MTSARRRTLVAALSVAALATAAFAQTGDKPRIGDFGFDVKDMDTSVAPGDDFAEYAGGHWIKTTPIPPDQSRWGGFGELNNRTTIRLRELMEGAGASNAPLGSVKQQVGDLYAAYMDEPTVEAKGLSPLKPTLARIDSIRDKRALASAIGATWRSDTDPLNDGRFSSGNVLGGWIGEDLRQPAKYAAYLFEGGLTLGDADYYLKDTPRNVALRKTYAEHMARMFTLAGYTDGAARAARVLALETALARTHLSIEASQDPEKADHVWRKAQFAKDAPGMDWEAFFTAAGLSGPATIRVWQPQAIVGEARVVGSADLQSWKDYLVLHALERWVGGLPHAFVDERFTLIQAMSGTPQMAARWKRAVGLVSGTLSDPTGEIYTAADFSPAAKAKAQVMVKNLLTAFDARIDKLAWMSPATKAKAHHKLSTLRVSVGYPDHWRDYSGLKITRDDLMGDLMRADAYDRAWQLSKLKRAKVDRTEWHMAAQAVNAQQAPLPNMIVFPAAILQPPFFDPRADAAVNYGGVGGTIGHEISHNFDNTGALFDWDGALRNWWTKEDFAQFTAATQRLVKQYDAYAPFPDVHINGQQTLSENIADVAGLAAAYDAYHLSLAGKSAPVIDGLSGDQRFYLGWAQAFRDVTREAALRRQVLTDPHSPGRYRIYTVRNQDPWYAAFHVKPGQTLYLAPADRVRIW